MISHLKRVSTGLRVFVTFEQKKGKRDGELGGKCVLSVVVHTQEVQREHVTCENQKIQLLRRNSKQKFIRGKAESFPLPFLKILKSQTRTYNSFFIAEVPLAYFVSIVVAPLPSCNWEPIFSKYVRTYAEGESPLTVLKERQTIHVKLASHISLFKTRTHKGGRTAREKS